MKAFGKLVDILVLRRHYKNWFSILIGHLVGRKVKIFLRDGLKIDISKGSRHSQAVELGRLLDAGWKVNLLNERFLELYDKTGIRVKCRYNEGLDIVHLAEIFLDKAYGTDFAGKVVIDVGMSNGDSSTYFASKGASKVIGSI